MKKPIDTVAKGRDTVASILAEFLKYSEGNSKNNYEEKDLLELIYIFQELKRTTSRERYFYRLSYLIKEYRNIDSHTAASPQAKAKDPLFIASALDSMRIFTDYLVDEINGHRKRLKIAPLEKPFYDYLMEQPKSLNTTPNQKNSPQQNYVKIPYYPFDLTHFINTRFDRVHYQKILEELNYFQLGSKVLFVQMYGDNFAYYEDRSGYVGNCREVEILANGNNTIEVDKIIIIHFYEGDKSSKAHLYLADYDKYEIRSEYEPRRYRYHFQNIFSCGDIKEEIIDDVREIAIVVNVPYF